MPPDIPNSVPDKIRELIYSIYGEGSIAALARDCGLDYATAHSTLCRSKHRVLKNLQALADVAHVSLDELAKTVLIENLEIRDFKLSALRSAAGLNNNQEWSLRAGLANTALSTYKNRLTHSHLTNVVLIASKLNLSLFDFGQLYKHHLAVAV